MELGKLKKVENLREIWENEERCFTPWLAQEENMKLLSETIGIPIKVMTNEAKVGKYELDIYGINEDTGDNIIIENQIEASDHPHLGKLLLYGAGYDAKTLIWIVKEATDEHKQAVEWLNEHSDESINIFLIKIELFKIDDSLPAPHFEVIAEPNNWTKILRNSGKNIELSGAKLKDLNFWQGFVDYCKRNRTTFSMRKALPQQWYDLSLGSNGNLIRLTVSQHGDLNCSLYINNNKELFNELYANKDNIETLLGYSVIWDYKENRGASSVDLKCNFNVDWDSENYDESYEWLMKTAENFKKVFKKFLK